MLERFYAAADEIVERFGGSIDKHIGDSVMAVFGAPVAHDDDAIRAVRAAAEIHRAMPTLGGARGRAAGRAHRHRVGRGRGERSRRDRHRAYTVIGNSVNLAARLLKLAGAGETVLDEAVHAAVAARSPAARRSRTRRSRGSTRRSRHGASSSSSTRADRAGAHPFVGRARGARAARGVARRAARPAERAARCSCAATPESASRDSSASCAGRALAAGLRVPYGARARFRHGQGARRDPRDRRQPRWICRPDRTATRAARRCAQLLARHPALAKEEPFLRDLLDLPQPAEGDALYEAMDNAARQQRSRRGRRAAARGRRARDVAGAADRRGRALGRQGDAGLSSPR